MILLFIAVNTALSFYQEYHSGQALAALKHYLSGRARVRREGREHIVGSRELVPGDIVLVETGDNIPADLRFLGVNNLAVDEEILTGESKAVAKVDEVLERPVSQMYQAWNIGFSGTTVVSGRGVGVVIATAGRTVSGDIAHLVQETHRESSFEKGIGRFSRFIMRMVLVTLSIVFLANVIIKGEAADVTALLIFSLALAVSVVPEALPVITTVSLSRGAARLARQKVVVKRLSAVEDLGSIEVLCADKTGTLTENILGVERVVIPHQQGRSSQENQTVQAECLTLATMAGTFPGGKRQTVDEAFDVALWKALEPSDQKHLKTMERLNELPFDPERKRGSVLMRTEQGYELIVRGAPEVLMSLAINLTPLQKEHLHQTMITEGKQGKRVLAVARKSVFQDSAYTPEAETALTFMGLIFFADPIKESAREAVREALHLGVKVKILTGDSPEVAGVVAERVGLIRRATEVLTGEEWEALSPEGKRQSLEQYSVFARVSPRQKYEIVKLLQEKNEVGFLGEGINDAPALKLANVALVVESAADIAREAADVVLLERDLGVIVEGIREGRRIFANIIKYLKATLISNFGNFYSVALVSLLLNFLPLLPLQILLMNLLSDLPMIALATDTVDNEELKRPKNYQIGGVVLFATLLGAVSTFFDFIFLAFFYSHNEPAVLQTYWFLFGMATELALIFSIRTRFFFLHSRPPSTWLLIFSILMFCLTFLIPFTAWGQKIFHFIEPEVWHIGLILTIVAIQFIATEVTKRLYYRIAKEEFVSPAPQSYTHGLEA